jgi:hypothetical protein
VTRRSLVVLADAGRATKTDDNEWVIARPAEELKPAKPAKATKAAEESSDAAEPTKSDYDVMKARKQWRELKAWQDGDRKGSRPETSDLDAMNAAHQDGRPRRKAKAKGERRSSKSPRGQEAAERQRELKNHRGKGRKVTEDELTDYVRKARQAHPDSRYDEQQYAYWVEGIAIGLPRWNSVWASLDGEFTSTSAA